MQDRPWDFMAKDTPSRDWTEGLGALITVAFFCGGIAGGLYLYSLYLNNLWGMFIGWTFALAMGVFDLIHLHNRKMVWKMVMRPNSSWISRGLLFVILFIGAGAINMAIAHWFPGNAFGTVFKVISGIAALGVATYSGFVMSYVSSVKFWHSAVMPVLFIAAGLAGGASIILVLISFDGAVLFAAAKTFTMSILAVYAVIIALHLWISTYNSTTARHSVMAILTGDLAPIFWGIIVVAGIVLPMAFIPLMSLKSPVLPAINAACVLIGNLALRYVILKAGRYSSLLPE
jgi:formate-dependent nitrite reductase membrane component NrfD